MAVEILFKTHRKEDQRAIEVFSCESGLMLQLHNTSVDHYAWLVLDRATAVRLVRHIKAEIAKMPTP